MCSSMWLIVQPNTISSSFTTPPRFPTWLPSSFSFISCISLSHYPSIWAQCLGSFSIQSYSASVASLARGTGRCCHRPCCRLRGAVRHDSAELAQLATPTETLRLLSCPSKGVRADMLAEPSKQNSHWLSKKWEYTCTYTHTHTSLNKPWRWSCEVVWQGNVAAQMSLLSQKVGLLGSIIVLTTICPLDYGIVDFGLKWH